MRASQTEMVARDGLREQHQYKTQLKTYFSALDQATLWVLPAPLILHS